MGRNAHELPNTSWLLWTGGGTNDVSLQNRGSNEEIELPSSLLRMLVADDLRSQKINEFEQSTDNHILGLKE